MDTVALDAATSGFPGERSIRQYAPNVRVRTGTSLSRNLPQLDDRLLQNHQSRGTGLRLLRRVWHCKPLPHYPDVVRILVVKPAHCLARPGLDVARVDVFEEDMIHVAQEDETPLFQRPVPHPF